MSYVLTSARMAGELRRRTVLGPFSHSIYVEDTTAAATTYTKAGTAAAEGVGSGAQASTLASTVSIDRVGIQVTYAPTAPTGVIVKTGAAAAGAAALGSKTVQQPVTSTKTGTGAAAEAAGGSKTVTPASVYTKAGLGAAAGAAGGSKVLTGAGVYAKTGTGASARAAAGTETVQHPVTSTKAGTGAAGAAASGVKTVATVTVSAKAGTAVAATTAAGSKAVTPANTYTEAGISTIVGAAHGSKVVQLAGTVIKTGTGAVGASATGTDAVQHAATPTKTGVGATAGATAGSKTVTAAAVRTKTGSGAAVVATGGLKLVQSSGQYVKTGTGAASATAAGVDEIDLAGSYDKAGAGAATGAAAGVQTHANVNATVTPATASAGASVVFAPGILTQTLLIADNPVTVRGSALNPTISGSAFTVLPATAGAYGTAQGATVDAQDGVAGPTNTAIAVTAQGAGHAFSGHWRVTLRPAAAAGTGGVGAAVAMVTSLSHRLHAGTPRVIPGVVIGAPVEQRSVQVVAVTAAMGTHAGEPVLV